MGVFVAIRVGDRKEVPVVAIHHHRDIEVSGIQWRHLRCRSIQGRRILTWTYSYSHISTVLIWYLVNDPYCDTHRQPFIAMQTCVHPYYRFLSSWFTSQLQLREDQCMCIRYQTWLVVQVGDRYLDQLHCSALVGGTDVLSFCQVRVHLFHTQHPGHQLRVNEWHVSDSLILTKDLIWLSVTSPYLGNFPTMESSAPGSLSVSLNFMASQSGVSTSLDV